jgi:hypothetical protein
LKILNLSNNLKIIQEEVKPKVRITKLVECPKCKKSMTAKSLRYTHDNVCTGEVPKPKEVKRRIKKAESAPAASQPAPQPTPSTITNNQHTTTPQLPPTEIHLPHLTMREHRIKKLSEQKERYKNLFQNAV